MLGLGWLATFILGIIIGAAVLYKNYIFWDFQANQKHILTEIEKIKKEREWVDFLSKCLEDLTDVIETGDANRRSIKQWNDQMREMGKKSEKGDEKNAPKKEAPDFKPGREVRNK
jgi:hypothetical protein